jgi:xylitol oxidase
MRPGPQPPSPVRDCRVDFEHAAHLVVAASNWAGNYEYRAERLHHPATLEQVQEIVAAARRLRVLGSRHSFNAIADSTELISLDGLPPTVAVDHAAGTVGCAPGVRYGELAQALAVEGLALHNLASLPHISVAGAVETATHGSGDANGNPSHRSRRT